MKAREPLDVRRATGDDWPAIWQIFRVVVESGDTYAFAPSAAFGDGDDDCGWFW